MTIETVVTVTCDLCGDTNVMKPEQATEKQLGKYICVLRFDHPHLDRGFITKHVCPKCVSRVMEWHHDRITEKVKRV